MSKWTDLFAELRRVYRSTSTLLLDADRAMGLRGFKVDHPKGNQIGIERSGHLTAPDLWAPAWVARFYHSSKAPPPAGAVAYICSMLADGGGEDDEDRYKLPTGEPMLAAGILRYGAKGDHWDWRYWMACSWCWLASGADPEGRWFEDRREWLHRWGIRQVETFAVPLVRIGSRADLEQKIIEPLVSRVEAREEPDVFNLIAQLPAGTRTKDEIDARLRAERAAWGDL